MESSFIVIMGKDVIPVNIGNNLPYNHTGVGYNAFCA